MPANKPYSRRALLLAGAGAAAARVTFPQASKEPLTAGHVIERIKTNVGIPWRAQTVDRIVAGSPEVRVRGIATTMMATLEVCQRASAAGRNLVITHEPTFYSHQDKTDTLVNDPAYQFKCEFLTKHEMAVFHFHDHWHARKPDGIAAGMMRELGWEKNADAQGRNRFTFPGVSLARFAKEMQAKLNIRVMRVVGDPSLLVKRVAASWGNFSAEPAFAVLAQPEVDVLVVGETREWELVEYAQDLISSGQKKALIILGHVVSEQAGMKECASWLRTFIPEVPVEFVPAPEPYWSPGHPPA
jgi:putative NIF3 family GTP cyclohydrolase 1 type 2